MYLWFIHPVKMVHKHKQTRKDLTTLSMTGILNMGLWYKRGYMSMVTPVDDDDTS